MKTIINKIIKILFLILFLCIPLIFTQFNSELFELPKMFFVYFFTVLITTLHLINVIKNHYPLKQKTILDIPLILFLLSQTISTVFSIDPHTSIFGYYSRLNGGLLSLYSYSILYWILSTYLDFNFKKQIINFFLVSGLLVSIYAILQHFGIDKNWWVQDVQNRVFSTLGQPNWLAAYLCLLIPFSIYLFLEIKNIIHQSYYLLLTFCFYSSLLFTKSKSGIIACLISITLFLIFYYLNNRKTNNLLIKKISIFVLTIFILSIVINNPIKDIILPQKTLTTDNSSSKILITPSQNIRKIVWQGSIDLWKKFPLFGTGVETFAYSYYWTRPIEHNLTSEWDYLYNKAHNEYLNYLATTGILGIITYLFFIISVFYLISKNYKSPENKNLSLLVFSAFLSILITNFAGFSVVTTSLFFFLLPSLLNPNYPIPSSKSKFNKSIYLIIPIIIITSLFLLQKIIFFYLADITYYQAEIFYSQNNHSKALDYITISHKFNPQEPLYTDKLASIYSKIALNTKNQSDINQAIKYSDLTISISPANINFWKQRAQTFLYLSTINSDYFSESITSLTKANLLAPTDPKIYYSIGQFLETASLNQEAIPYYQKAIEIKSNYDYAYFALAKIYLSQKEYKLAKDNLQKTIDYSYPTNTEAEKLLENIKNY